jgi:hypothetical protein
MNIDLNKKELELLEAALFTHIIKKRNKLQSAPLTEEEQANLPDHINNLEELGHKLWLIRAGIK